MHLRCASKNQQHLIVSSKTIVLSCLAPVSVNTVMSPETAKVAAGVLSVSEVVRQRQFGSGSEGVQSLADRKSGGYKVWCIQSLF